MSDELKEIELPVDIGVIYEGERIRGPDTYVELGGPKVKYKFELVKMRDPKKIEDGEVKIVGLDLKEMEEGSRHPFGIYVEVSGEEIEEDLEPVIERRIHDFCNYVEGFMHLNQRYDIWCRLSKKSFSKGFDSLKYLGYALIKLFKTELSIIEKIQITIITEEERVAEILKLARKIYEARDARARELSDEDVDEFYSCVLCQSFAPTHVCVVSPDKTGLCGSVSWFDGRASFRIDPKGANFPITKGECLDSVRGEYTGINEAISKYSLGETERLQMHSMFGHPTTSCGCFEAILFYVPEVDGIGIAHRDYHGETIMGVPFSTLATQTGGGKQVEGFMGCAIEYMRSPKFIQADGGWSRIVWVPKAVKERVKDAIPKEFYDKIATEEDTTNLSELKSFLKEKDHPVVSSWEEVEEALPAEAPKTMEVPELEVLPAVGAAGFKIILKNVKIYAEKAIIKRIK
ncbi:MAG: CO dehydrogenase/CO-methylating acetyl-CoA synthase complex subunit beta [Candidatus Methanofastidiosia archaeon]